MGNLLYEPFSQTVAINGLSIDVRDMSIKESVDDRTPTIDFVIERDVVGDTAYQLSAIGATVNVIQTVGNTTIQNNAIVTNVQHRRIGGGDIKRVKALGEEWLAAQVRFLDSWEQIGASDLVRAAWGKYAPGFAVNAETNNTVIENYSSTYDTLYDLMERVCQVTEWAWSISGGAVFFFDPGSRTSPSIRQPEHIIGDTLDVTEAGDGVVNISYMPAYEYSAMDASYTGKPGECVQVLSNKRTQRLAAQDWEFATDPVVEVSGQAGTDYEIKGLQEGETLSASFTDGRFRLSRQVAPVTDQGRVTVRVRGTIRRSVWTTAEHTASLSEFGPRPGQPLQREGAADVATAHQIQRSYLDERAFPLRDVTLETPLFGIVPDSVLDIELSSPALATTLYVTSVRRTTSGTELNVQVQLTELVDDSP